MLRRRAARLSVIAVLVAAGILVSVPAHADRVVCPPDGSDCYVVADKPGKPGVGDRPGGDTDTSGCTWKGKRYPCTQPGWGHFNSADGCYYVQESPQPAAGDPAWAGHAPGDGAMYRRRCFGDLVGVLVWRAAPPPGAAGVSAEELAARAVRLLPLRGPAIGIAPSPSGRGLVGLPVWMWTAVSPETWGPATATASVPGMSVTARAQASRIVWSMGDGRRVVCANPGTPYAASYGGSRSPTCGHVYAAPSRTAPSGRYPVTATTTWEIDWFVVGGGQTGALTVTRSSATSVRIDELQVVTK